MFLLPQEVIKVIVFSNHPEAEESEVLLGNFSNIEVQALPWQTKRSGVTPFDPATGYLLKTFSDHPVFVQMAELVASGADIEVKELDIEQTD